MITIIKNLNLNETQWSLTHLELRSAISIVHENLTASKATSILMVQNIAHSMKWRNMGHYSYSS